jgi:uncharacterized protein (DUF58 family)
MDVTRRWWATAALAVLLAVGAVVLQRPLLLAGTAILGGWLLARQARFGLAATRTAEALDVTIRPARESVFADEVVTVTARATLDEPARLPVEVAVTPPVGATGSEEDDLALSIPADERAATTTFSISFPVAGDHRFGQPSVTLTDPDGLFESHPQVDPGPTLTVEPRTPRNVHVGEGGEQVAGAFGEHATGKHGPGLVPSDLREYVAGDPADSIDWKATARLQEPHVRQYDVEVDLETALLLDHRASMAEGRAGRRKLDFGRAVALGYLSAAARDDEAVGLYAVGDEGLTERDPPDTGSGHYERLRVRIHDLDPTTGDQSGPDAGWPPGEARRAAQHLAGDDAAFTSVIRPFLGDREQYVSRIDGDPLYRAVRSQIRSLNGTAVTVLITDDSRPAEVREAVELATRGDDSVVAFLLPSVLFEPGGMADLDAAYERYVQFEEFRRELASLPRVSAFEVAPGDRIDALLAARGRREVA